MAKWAKKTNTVKFDPRIPCPWYPADFPTNLSLCRHVLHKHNWNKDFLKGFEILETHGSVMIVKEKE